MLEFVCDDVTSRLIYDDEAALFNITPTEDDLVFSSNETFYALHPSLPSYGASFLFGQLSVNTSA